MNYILDIYVPACLKCYNVLISFAISPFRKISFWRSIEKPDEYLWNAVVNVDHRRENPLLKNKT